MLSWGAWAWAIRLAQLSNINRCAHWLSSTSCRPLSAGTKIISCRSVQRLLMIPEPDCDMKISSRYLLPRTVLMICSLVGSFMPSFSISTILQKNCWITVAALFTKKLDLSAFRGICCRVEYLRFGLTILRTRAFSFDWRGYSLRPALNL